MTEKQAPTPAAPRGGDSPPALAKRRRLLYAWRLIRQLPWLPLRYKL